MAIVITQARFDTKGPQGVAAKPQDGLDAAGRLVAWIGGTLIASYRTSGDHDVLFIFEADSCDQAIRALGAAAPGSGLADLKTVRVLASRETKPAMSGAEGASAAKLAATDPIAHTALSQAEGSANQKDADAEAANRILDARSKSVEDIAAGRAAPYYLDTPVARLDTGRASACTQGRRPRKEVICS
jgi:uncharacterized protein with GYD domain